MSGKFSDRTGLASTGPSRARLLLVDDDAAIGRVVSRMLRDSFDVTVFTDAGEAVQLITAGERYDAILCDLMMPRVTGMDFYEQLAGVHQPSLERFIFLTGGAFTQRAEDFLRHVKNPRLEKPFDRAMLLAALATVLEVDSP